MSALDGLAVTHVVNTAEFAGVERHVVTLATEQARRGLRVTVHGGSPDRMTTLLGESVRYVPFRGVLTCASDLRGAPRADLLHAHMTSAELSAVISSTAAPIVATRHFAARRGKSVPGRIAAPLLRRGIDRQIAVSNFVARRIDGLSVVIPNAVDTTADHRHRPEPYVLVAQRLEVEKQTQVGIRAFQLSGLAESGWRLLIAGEGSQRASLQQEFESLDGIEFLGFRSDVHNLMLHAAGLLATAPDEPFGLSVVEAMARGVPVIAAAGGAHRETVGLAADPAMFPVGDAHRAAVWLTRLRLDFEWAESYGRELRSLQRIHFNPALQTIKTLRIYEEVLNRA